VSTHTPEWAAPLTGLDTDTITSIARDIGTTKATMLRALIGAEHHYSGATVYRLLSMIPVLTGSHKVLGGGFARSVGAWSEQSDVDISAVASLAGQLVPDEGNRRSFDQPRLGQTLTEIGSPIRALFLWNGNPVLTMPDAAAVRRGLGRDDLFTVVSEQFMTDTARYADVILPAAMETEQLDVIAAWGHLWLGWNEPATEPLGEAVSNTELFRRLATAFGFNDPQLHLSDLEQIVVGVGDHVDIEQMRSKGFVRVTEFPERYLPYANGAIATQSGKAELVTDSIEIQGLTRLPQWVPITEGRGGDDGAYPLCLQTPKKATRFLNTSYSGLGNHAEREAVPHVELDAVDAADRGLQAGDMARVFNSRASLELPVAISDRLRPGVVSVPWGYVEAAYGDTIGSVNDLTNAADTEISGGSSYGDTLVQVEAIPT
jgi:anaerobic selenocysteine-containing dehydrogenase